ncbi:MAG: amidase [Betaproteobacteria bacterium]|nr:amidase [Betaproteobacteria bacterium]MBI2291032.1 amidase [Betaproteobacteria bacterium]MBI3053532.1 amidase [Betaproteobacteria bacterium]
MSADLLNMSLCEVAQAIRRKRVSSLEVTRACLARAKAVQPTVNCFIAIEEDEALRAARAADRAVKRGAKLGSLHGVPLAHKDMFYRAGRVSTGGSKILRDYRPTVTATVVERLAAAGAIWLGNLNMAEFAANPTGHNEHWGDCCNPWNTAHITGGSSSGSGAAVAARTCYGSLGSDTGGSIRLPAAANGVVGLKPTYGRVSRHAILPRVWSLDTVGPLTRTVRDCARITAVIAGADPLDPTASAQPVPNYERLLDRRIRGWKIGVPRNHFYDGIAEDVRRAMEESLAVLRSLGARIIELDVPDPQHTYQLTNAIGQVESATIYANWLRERPQDFSLVVRTRTEAGMLVPGVSYLEALNARPRIAAEFVRQVYGTVDALHAPVMTMPVPTRAETTPGGSGEVMDMLARLTHNTRPINFLGLPSLAVPAGFADNGLPVAFQLIGRPFAEDVLLRIGDAFQAETDWHARAPTS